MIHSKVDYGECIVGEYRERDVIASVVADEELALSIGRCLVTFTAFADGDFTIDAVHRMDVDETVDAGVLSSDDIDRILIAALPTRAEVEHGY